MWYNGREMKKLLDIFHGNHKKFWVKENTQSLLLSLAFFLVALYVQQLANNYVNQIKGVAVNDIVLDFLPTLDIDFFIIQGALLLSAVSLALFLFKPKYLSFGLKSLSVFILARSFFITLTHLGASPNQLVLDQNSFGFGLYNLLFNTHGDFFFSGHTGVPFLLALIFWQEKVWRYIFIAASVILGLSVLFAHIHYSIDVFAAPFITYAIYALCRKFFPKSYSATQGD